MRLLGTNRYFWGMAPSCTSWLSAQRAAGLAATVASSPPAEPAPPPSPAEAPAVGSGAAVLAVAIASAPAAAVDHSCSRVSGCLQ